MSGPANRAWTAARAVRLSAILTMILGGAGFMPDDAWNAFVLDDYDAYGQVPIPGEGRVDLPAGDMKIRLSHVDGRVVERVRVAAAQAEHRAPEGVADPVLTENQRHNQCQWRYARSGVDRRGAHRPAPT